MDAPARRPWFRVAVLAAVLYLVIGRVFAIPVHNARAWRLAAWVVSGVVFAAHIAYEHFRPRNSPRTTAAHAALGSALGSFGLAVVGMVFAFAARPETRLRWLVALVAWPAITAVPAFLVALVAARVLARLPRQNDTPRNER